MQSVAFAAPILPGKTDVDPAAFAALATSDAPFDQWFRGILQEVHGIDLSAGMAPPEQMVDDRRG